MPAQRDIILASASPRRSDLLKQVGLEFRVLPSEVDEHLDELVTPGRHVEILAERKARAVAEMLEVRDSDGNPLIIAADTIVVLDDHLLEKPVNEEHALEMLKQLRGREHRVYSSLCVLEPKSDLMRLGRRCTHVVMDVHSDERLRAYVDSGEPMDKAGAYGIQGRGAVLVREIRGDYFNVVGLSLALLAEYLADFDVLIPG